MAQNGLPNMFHQELRKVAKNHVGMFCGNEIRDLCEKYNIDNAEARLILQKNKQIAISGEIIYYPEFFNYNKNSKISGFFCAKGYVFDLFRVVPSDSYHHMLVNFLQNVYKDHDGFGNANTNQACVLAYHPFGGLCDVSFIMHEEYCYVFIHADTSDKVNSLKKIVTNIIAHTKYHETCRCSNCSNLWNDYVVTPNKVINNILKICKWD